MAGLLNIPKLVDYRNKVKRHPTLKFPVRKLSQKNTIAIHHSLTKQGLGGSNAESYARFHVDSHGWPSIGYSYVIEPDGTIKFCNDIQLRTYHVGNHNDYAIGICLTGDFRYEEPTEAQKQSLRNLVNGLKKEYPHIKYVKGHNEFSGYEWKQCPVFDYKAVLSEKGTVQKPKELPSTYVIQQGDTFWSIAKGLDNITVDDLIKANPNIDHTKLKVGQKINLGKNVTETPKKEVKPKQSNPKATTPTTEKIDVVVDVPGYYTSADAKSKKNRRTTVKKGNYFVFNRSDGMVNVSSKSGVAGSWINPSDNKKPSPKPKPTPKKSLTRMAQEIIDGKHGNGHEARRKNLGISASEYEKVRAEVNRLLGASSSPSKPKKSISQMADEVIRGLHGQGHENRRKSLGISKAEYEKVRAEVNRRL